MSIHKTEAMVEDCLLEPRLLDSRAARKVVLEEHLLEVVVRSEVWERQTVVHLISELSLALTCMANRYLLLC